MLSRPGTKLGLSAAVVIAVYLILYEHTEVGILMCTEMAAREYSGLSM